MTYLYFLINIASLSIPLLYSFQKKMRFIQYWKTVLFGIVIMAIPFLIWDIWFTKIGVWGFNTKYLLGINILNLPIEEVLFFFCIPYASIFTHYALLHFFPNLKLSSKITSILNKLLFLVAISIVLFNYDKWYTLINFLVFSVFLVYALVSKDAIISSFYITFLVILLPFFIVNGLLTGSFIDEQVVWYNNAENLGIRLGTVPIEDVFYAFSMLYGPILVIERLKPILNKNR